MFRSFRSAACVVGAVFAFGVYMVSEASAQYASWHGPYFGLNVGGGIADATGGDNLLDFDANGAVYGGHAGYQLQFGSLVVGAEADLMFGDVSSEQRTVDRDLFNGVTAVDSFNYETRSDLLASLRGRIGHAMGPLLVYGTAGIAWNRIDFKADARLSSNGLDVDDFVKDDQFLFGWVAGGGAAFKISNSVSVQLDILHYQFDDDLVVGGLGIDDLNMGLTTARVGVTFQLN